MHMRAKNKRILVFHGVQSISDVTSTCSNMRDTVLHTGDSTWRSHPMLTWIP